MNSRRAPIRFEVSVNGAVRRVIGVGEFGVLSAIVGWVRRNPHKSYDVLRDDPSIDRKEFFETEISIQLGGLDSSTDRDIQWPKDPLEPGDVVTIKILSDGEYDEPVNS